MKIGSVVCLHTPVSPRVPDSYIYIYMLLGASFLDVPVAEFMYFVFTRMPRGVAVGDRGLSRCVPCILSAVISLW